MLQTTFCQNYYSFTPLQPMFPELEVYHKFSLLLTSFSDIMMF